jgi:hypothetical protein
MRSQFSKFSPETKATLWRAHILKHLEGSLTVEQRLALESVVPYLGNEAYRKGTPESDNARIGLTALNAELHRVFTREEGAIIFDRIDTDVWDRYTPMFIVNARFFEGSCGCSTSSDWCGSHSVCNGGGCTATTDGGCGTLWLYNCTGTCGQGVPEND